MGRSSFTFEQQIFAGDQRVGGGGAVVVLADDSGPLQLPDALVDDLAELRLPETQSSTIARPDARRLERDHYRFWSPITARIGDVDSNQHVNFIALAGWYDEAVAAFTIGSLGTDDTGPLPDLPPWSYEIQYLGEVTYPGAYEIGLAVRSADTTSVNYELGVFRDSACLGVASAVGANGVITEALRRA